MVYLAYSMVIFHGELLVITRGYNIYIKQHPLDAMFWPWQPVQWPQVLRKAQPSDDGQHMSLGKLGGHEVIHQAERWISEANKKGFRFKACGI